MYAGQLRHVLVAKISGLPPLACGFPELSPHQLLMGLNESRHVVSRIDINPLHPMYPCHPSLVPAVLDHCLTRPLSSQGAATTSVLPVVPDTTTQLFQTFFSGAGCYNNTLQSSLPVLHWCLVLKQLFFLVFHWCLALKHYFSGLYVVLSAGKCLL